MNLLAHAILSPPNDAILVGNVTADWIKGRARRGVAAGIQEGFTLHRHIDIFTDTHAIPAGCAARLAERWNRYAGILVDIFFDHLLASGWREHSAEPLAAFTARTYATLHEHLPVLPETVHFPIYALTSDDWFAAYRTLDGIRLTLTRMSARLQARGHAVELAPAVDDFAGHRDFFAAAFGQFFPQLRRHVAMLEASRAA